MESKKGSLKTRKLGSIFIFHAKTSSIQGKVITLPQSKLLTLTVIDSACTEESTGESKVEVPVFKLKSGHHPLIDQLALEHQEDRWCLQSRVCFFIRLK